MRTLLAATLFLTLLLLQAACADPAARRRDALGPLEARFLHADTDGDEALSHAEVETGMPGLRADFVAIDTDDNGRISRAELRSYRDWQRILALPRHEGPAR